MDFKKLIPHLIAIVIFVIASLLYFNPILSGKKMKQSDITQFIGMSKEVVNYRKDNDKEPYWLGNAFSGMPAYQVSAYYPNDFIRYIDKVIRFLPRPADYLFLYFLSFFVLLSALKVDWKLAILGALSFGFSTYLIIIFGAGHNAKAHAIGYIPLVMAGILYIFQKRYLLGFVLTGLAMSLEIYANHPQITYYLGFSLVILVIVEFINAVKHQLILDFARQAGIIVMASIIGLAINAPRLMAMKEYSEFSTRGQSELTINPDGTPKEKSTGLDKDYITQYSYGIWETFNLMIPRFMGGGTVSKLDKDSEFYKVLETNAGSKIANEYSRQALTYWGMQPFVEAPAYIGAILFFLFFLGVFLVEGKVKHWLVASVVFSILMSWGKNFEVLTNFFIDYVPLYNKFRAVSSIQIIAEVCVPLLGILALKRIFSSDISQEIKKTALKKSLYVAGGISLFFTLFGSSLFAFEGVRDRQYQELPVLIDAMINDRKSMLFFDSVRSLILILLSGGLLWFFFKNKIKQIPVIISIGVLILFDLVSVNLNYVDKENFVIKPKVVKPFVASKADTEILKDKSYYRVANFSVNPMEDGRTSYFHNSIGGYHAAKMEKYQELFEYQIAKNNIEVLNMLNAKYFIIEDNEVKENSEANGNVWFVEKVNIVNSANEEIQALDSLKTKKEAVINLSNFENFYNSNRISIFQKDSTALIQLKKNNITELVYKSSTSEEQFAVFSEIYYKNGWNAYVDGKLTPHYNVNYVLRGMIILKGKHIIEFKFEPTIIQKGSLISILAYLFFLIAPAGWWWYDKKKIKI